MVGAGQPAYVDSTDSPWLGRTGTGSGAGRSALTPTRRGRAVWHWRGRWSRWRRRRRWRRGRRGVRRSLPSRTAWMAVAKRPSAARPRPLRPAGVRGTPLVPGRGEHHHPDMGFSTCFRGFENCCSPSRAGGLGAAPPGSSAPADRKPFLAPQPTTDAGSGTQGLTQRGTDECASAPTRSRKPAKEHDASEASGSRRMRIGFVIQLSGRSCQLTAPVVVRSVVCSHSSNACASTPGSTPSAPGTPASLRRGRRQ
jgi:hypothetical protein